MIKRNISWGDDKLPLHRRFAACIEFMGAERRHGRNGGETCVEKLGSPGLREQMYFGLDEDV